MPADDMQLLREEMSHMRRILMGMGQMGRVAEVKKGRVRIVYGKGDGGDDGKKDTGVWVRTAHGGAQSEGRQWSVGETVATWAVGGNPEHCHVVPSGWNDKHPRDGNDTDDNGTRRWRKPPGDGDDGGNGDGDGSGGDGDSEGGDQGGDQGDQGGSDGDGGAGEGSDGTEGKGADGEEEKGSYGDDKNDAKQWKDAKTDHQEINTHDKRQHKFDKYAYTATDDGGEMKWDDKFLRIKKGEVEIGKGDEVQVHWEDGKMTVKCDIVDKNGRKFAVMGTLTADGKPLVAKFANEA